MDFSQVFESPLNFSVSKQTYSIPRAIRFRDNPQTHRSTYYYPEKIALTNRSTAFGKESKTKSYVKIGPAPGDYSLKSDFNLNNKKGYSFGNQKGRTMKKMNIAPGPGQYDIKSSNNNGYSFGKNDGRSLTPRQQQSIISSQYYLRNLDTIRPTSAILTKYKNPQYGVIGTARRFSPRTTSPTPGPSNYGHLYYQGTSKYKSKPAISFARSIRNNDDRSISPGPTAQYYNNNSVINFHSLQESINPPSDFFKNIKQYSENFQIRNI